jgi:hypothetical protein
LFHAFRDHDARPLLLGKIPRDGVARRRVLHEHDYLRELEATAPRLSGVWFPRPLFVDQTGARTATAQSVLAGVRPDAGALRDASPESARGAYDRALQWLRRFWKETGFLEGTEAALWHRFLRSARAYLETFQPRGDERHDVEAIIWEIEARRELVALCGFGHGSFEPDNLSARGAGAANWERAARRQLPWVDPVHFSLHASARVAQLEGATIREGFERGFFEAGWLRDLNRRFLEECFHEGGVPLDRLPLALAASVLVSTIREARSFFLDEPRVAQWRSVVRRCLHPGAREELAAFWS